MPKKGKKSRGVENDEDPEEIERIMRAVYGEDEKASEGKEKEEGKKQKDQQAKSKEKETGEGEKQEIEKDGDDVKSDEKKEEGQEAQPKKKALTKREQRRQNKRKAKGILPDEGEEQQDQETDDNNNDDKNNNDNDDNKEPKKIKGGDDATRDVVEELAEKPKDDTTKQQQAAKPAKTKKDAVEVWNEEKGKSRSVWNLKVPLKALDVKGTRVLVGGGGGDSKVGLANLLFLFEWSQNSSDPKNKNTLKLLCCDATPTLVSSVALHPMKDSEGVCGMHNFIQRFVLNKQGSGFEWKQMKISDFAENDAAQKKLCFTSDGTSVVTVGADHKIRVWSYPELSLTRTITSSMEVINDVQVSPDYKWIAASSNDNQCKIFDLSAGTCTAILKNPHGGDLLFKNVGFLSNGELLVAQIRRPGGSRTQKIKGQSWLNKWDVKKKKWNQSACVSSSTHHTAFSLAHYDDGTAIIGLGDEDGRLTTYDENLSRGGYGQEQHSWITTGVGFPKKTAIVSISADCTLITSTPRASLPVKQILLLLLVILIIAVVALVFRRD